MSLREIPYKVERWLERGAELRAGPGASSLQSLPLGGAVPYAEVTPGAGVSAPLVYLPGDQAIADNDVRGKILVRDATPGSVPNAAFTALQWFTWDPEQTLTPTVAGNYERDYLAYEQRIHDLEEAAHAGAAGLVFVHGFPREQIRGQYAPYEGKKWDVPAVYVGVDEGERIKELARTGGVGRIRLSASQDRAPTQTVVATLPGLSAERIVIESHTDGMNAVWDNGPIAMLALAKHFASLPIACRPRTLEFAFTTAHLFQQLDPAERDGGAEQYAEELDAAYEQGTLALVVALEHMGAREYAAVPRTDGGPGRELEQTGQSEPAGIFIGESPVLVEQVAPVGGRARSAPHARAARRRPPRPAPPAASQLRRRGRPVPQAHAADRGARDRSVVALQPGVRDGGDRRRAAPQPDAHVRRPPALGRLDPARGAGRRLPRHARGAGAAVRRLAGRIRPRELRGRAVIGRAILRGARRSADPRAGRPGRRRRAPGAAATTPGATRPCRRTSAPACCSPR